MTFFSRFFFSGFLALSFLLPFSAFAQQKVTVAQGYANIMEQGIIFANICTSPAPAEGGADPCQCRAQGICTLSEVVQIAVNFIIFLLGISGSVALLMFIYGGFNWVFAQGRPEYIQTGKDTMKHAMIGLAIVFGAYAIVNALLVYLGGITVGTTSTLEDTIEKLPAEENDASKPIQTKDILDTN